MKKLLLTCFVFLFTLSISAQDNTGNKKDVKNETGKADEKTVEFVKEAASGGMMEVQLGKIAQDKGSSQAVKDFGALMVKDHSKANEELKALAKKNNITIPEKLMDKHKKHVDELSKLSGSEFDEEYIDMMQSDHKEDISKFEDASEDLTNADIKSFAKKTLPALKQHKQKVDQISKDMKSISRGDDNNSKNE